MVRPSDQIQGTLDLLILKALASEPRHGWAIAKGIRAVSGMCCRSSRVRCTRRCFGWSNRD
jgi:hypothetical protein